MQRGQDAVLSQRLHDKVGLRRCITFVCSLLKYCEICSLLKYAVQCTNTKVKQNISVSNQTT